MFNAIQFSHAEDYAQLRYIMAFSWKQKFLYIRKYDALYFKRWLV